uniref:Gamma-aminobutyric acid type B receptor subunit 2 n=1 Tax=Drosophila melanogaster TaxID=7227 RepID=Q9Y133_DROME|nr:metabotropic GABA-B receptor subtype 2, isoform B [Drosophila melanogaster]AAD38614.1 BcDNA.GH07312 [Drosophila melanogaster]AAF55916.1 metabotropic GABA-B receptor subtype 2, isoform B [Drosophila melanogaster]AOQ14637.1 GABA-B-R2-PB [synthetic construct]|eukprot:NP_524438.1 metabotropic GABA-B receptor subtype 2, isoform B [Drosophila melanogaster]
MFRPSWFPFASLLFLLLWSTACGRTAKRSDVYIAGFFPYGDGVENSYTGRGVMPSVKLALGHVNEHGKILANYRLHMWWNDTQCNAAVGVKSFFDMMHSGPNKVMLFGAACTHVTDPIAKASKHWHLTQLSYADTHPMFTKDAFPNFFRVVPSENAFNAPRLALLKEFNWTRVGTVYQNEPRYSLPHNHMVADLDAMEVEVVETQSFVNDVAESLKKLREKDVRIILGNFNEHFARKAFCEAYKLDMYGRAYQWLIMATYSTDWWNVTQDSECSVEEIATALEGAILVDLLPLSTSGDITVAGITADEYLVEYDRLRGTEYSRFHGYTYDGIWAAALAIQYVAEKREDLLTHFDYRVKDWESVFLEALRNTSFEGVTGPVRFYNNERKANILINQFQLGQMEKIGEYHSQKSHLDLSLGKPVKWVGKTPPKDRTLIYIEHSQVNPTIYIVSASASVIGVIIATVFLAFNIKYRNQRYIKMSSPHLNNLIIVGCMMTYLSIIFLGLDTTLSSVAAFPYICTARAWILMAGFSLSFGAMFSKTWRVHSIFTDLKLNKKVIKDYQLFMVVGVLLAIDIAIITTWQIADPFYRETKQLEPLHHENIDDVLVIPENEYCQSEHMTIFVSIIYAYKGLLLVFGAFLAWETRHVSIPALNDSKHIGFSVYNVFITCLAGAAISLVLSDRKDLVFVLLSFFIIFCTTATLCLVFVPKLVELKRNPQGVVDKRVRATLRPMSKNGRRDSSVCELEQRLRDVKNTNCRFRKALMEKENELQALIRKLGPEARKWIDGVTCTGGSNVGSELEPILNDDIVRLSAPPVRREMPSTTEVTEMTSVDSVTSTHVEMDNSFVSVQSTVMAPSLPPKKKKQSIVEHHSHAPAPTMMQPIQQQLQQHLQQHQQMQQQHLQQQQHQQMQQQQQQQQHHHRHLEKRNSVSAQTDDNIGSITSTAGKRSGGDCSSMRERRQSTASRHYDSGSQTPTARPKYSSSHRNSSTNISTSQSELSNMCPHSKPSTPAVIKTPTASDHRRTSMGSALKSNFVVSQSDLWDTHTLSHAKQRQSPRNYASPQRCAEHHGGHGMTYDPNTTSPIQRSVSEKNRNKHRPKPQKGTVCQSETDSERERDPPPNSQPCVQPRKVSRSSNIQHAAHHHSSPNVAPDKQRSRQRGKQDSSIYGASSETELLEGETAILPIFRKLLTEKSPNYRGRSAVGQSCPNISIKCDIVEYL